MRRFPRIVLVALGLAIVVVWITVRVVRTGPSPRVVPNDNQATAGVVRDGVLTLDLEVRRAEFFPETDSGPSVAVVAFAEAGKPPSIPAPLIRVPEGTELHVSIRNTLTDSGVVFYGLHARPSALEDTVQLRPGARREVRFVAGAPGTYIYWGIPIGKTESRAYWWDTQLSGALIVDPVGTPPVAERVFVINKVHQTPARPPLICPDTRVARPWLSHQVCRARALVGRTIRPWGKRSTFVFTLNGRSWPHTPRLTYTEGDSVRWRVINGTMSPHPMHLHGAYFRVESRGIWAADTTFPPERQALAVTDLIPAASTRRISWAPGRPGNWIFHCHFAFHVSDTLLTPAVVPVADAGHGTERHEMEGLVLGISVQPAPSTARAADDARAPNERPFRLLVRAATDDSSGARPRFGYAIQHDGARPFPADITAPGPTIVLHRGRAARITVVNQLAEPTTIHWHGIELASALDGVPWWSGMPGRTMPPIAAGDSLVAEFVPPRAGTFIYHSHLSELHQVTAGLYGPLLVLEPGARRDSLTDHIIVVSQADFGLESRELVNGSPSPTPLELRAGATHRLRIINITTDWDVAIRLLESPADTTLAVWRPVAKDGADLPPALAVSQPARLVAGSGETADFELRPTRRGDMLLEVVAATAGRFRVPLLVRVR